MYIICSTRYCRYLQDLASLPCALVRMNVVIPLGWAERKPYTKACYKDKDRTSFAN